MLVTRLGISTDVSKGRRMRESLTDSFYGWGFGVEFRCRHFEG